MIIIYYILLLRDARGHITFTVFGGVSGGGGGGGDDRVKYDDV